MNDTTMLNEDLITTKKASTLFKYTSSYLAYLVRSKKINAHKLGKSWLIEKDSLLHFIAHHGKPGAKNIQTRAHPYSHEHKTHPVESVSVIPTSFAESNTMQSQSSSNDQYRISQKWVSKMALATILIMFTVGVFQFGPTLVQSPTIISWTNTLQMFPESISSAPLAIGEFVILTTNTIIATEAALVYRIAAAAPALSQATVHILISIGDELSNATARVPAQMASVFAHDAL